MSRNKNLKKREKIENKKIGKKKSPKNQYVRKYRFLGDFFFLFSFFLFFLDSYYDSPEIGVISKRPRPFMEPEIA